MSGISGGTARMVKRMPLPASHRRATRTGTDAENESPSVVGSGERVKGPAVTGFPQAAGARRLCWWAPRPCPPRKAGRGRRARCATCSHPRHERGRVREGEPLWQINRLRPLVELDVGTPGIGDERDPDAGRVLRVGSIELDAGRLEFLDKGLQVGHVEADVIENPPFGGGLRRIGLVEAKLGARNVGNRGVVTQARLRTEDLSVPGLTLGDRRFRQEKVDML